MLPNVPVHLIQRGNNRELCFFADDDYRFFLEWLEEYARSESCRMHAYVLMSNHVHLLLTGEQPDSIGNLMKRLGQRYVQYINRSYRRSGTLWEGRFRSCLANEEHYVLGCYRYIELNPVRAGMVEHPAEYRWSSYRVNGQGEQSTLIHPHKLYRELGSTLPERLAAYRELFRYQLDPGLVDEIRRATNGNYVLGTERFEAQVERVLKRRVTRGQPGRPKKEGA